jgi:hypothetical protein
MTQEQLSTSQVKKIVNIMNDLNCFLWSDTPEGMGYWSTVFCKLSLMAEHGTTDGKELLIKVGEGYREATKEDQDRPDLQRYSLVFKQWVRSYCEMNDINRYRVEADVVPTDEDAKERKRVMVWHMNKWVPMKLVYVGSDSCLFPFLAENENKFVDRFIKARRFYSWE